MMLKDYDPLNGSDGVHTIKVTLQCGDLRGSFTYEMGGNCKGREILDFDAESELDEDFLKKAKFENLEITVLDDEYLKLVLGEKEDRCSLEVDVREINSMIVGMEIVGFAEGAEREAK